METRGCERAPSVDPHPSHAQLPAKPAKVANAWLSNQSQLSLASHHVETLKAEQNRKQG